MAIDDAHEAIVQVGLVKLMDGMRTENPDQQLPSRCLDLVRKRVNLNLTSQHRLLASLVVL